MTQWFSNPQDTIEEAQQLHAGGLFNPAAVFRTKEGKYVMGLLSPRSDWPPDTEAKAIEGLTGNVMVSTCDPILNVWKPYKQQEEGTEKL
ncbi:MAG: hypothetical protein GY832_11245 [Chloroflexi bacterium]|nr:hypothetical protein [Chloroflexota bacterium]